MGKEFKKYKKTIEFDNVSLQGYIDQLDDKLCQSERMELVKSLLTNSTSHSEEYGIHETLNDFMIRALTEETNGIPIVNVHVGTTGNLSEDDTFFLQMQRFVNYILYAPDAERIDKKTKYNFYTEEEFKKVLNRSIPFSQLENNLSSEGNTNIEDSIDFLIRKQNNFKKSKYLSKIDKSMLNDVELKPLKDLQVAIDYLCRELMYLKKALNCIDTKDELASEIRAMIRKYEYLRSGYYSEQLEMHELIKKPIRFKFPIQESTVVDWSLFDFTDREQLKALLMMNKESNFDDFRDSLISDLYRFVKKCHFSEEQLEIIYLMQTGMSFDRIEKELELGKDTVKYKIDKIIDLIILQYNKDLEDFNYTFIEKGKYTKCEECGGNKLVSKYNKTPFCESCLEKIMYVNKTETKICTKCGIEKTLDSFGIDKKGVLGRDSACKKCKSKQRENRIVN